MDQSLVIGIGSLPWAQAVEAPGWMGLLLQAGAFGLLLLLLIRAPEWMRDARQARQAEAALQSQERAEERAARERQAEAERSARHQLADQFHASIIGALAANAQAAAQLRSEDHTARAEDRVAFSARTQVIVEALERQTAALILRLDQLATHILEVRELVVRAEHVTVTQRPDQGE